jgi:hypothetical protein
MHLLANRACNPDLLYRTGRPDREHRWVPGKTWARSTKCPEKTARHGVSRLAGQTETQAPDPTPSACKGWGWGAKEHSSSLHAD